MPNPTENGGGGGGPAEINLVDDDATDHATIPSDYTQQQHQQDEIYDPFAPVGGRPSAWATPRTSNAAATRYDYQRGLRLALRLLKKNSIALCICLYTTLCRSGRCRKDLFCG